MTTSQGDDQAQGGGGGGSATTGGINFQAAATAIAAVSMARGVPLGWLSGLTRDIPVSVAAETKGPGDDARLTLIGGEIVEAQMKRGLSAGIHLWAPLMKMAKGVQEGTIQYGVLVVSNESSGSIRNDLARDIIRMGDGRSDDLKDLARELETKLSAEGMVAQRVCSRLRIVTCHVDPGNEASVLAARAELAHLCSEQSQVINAWDAIYRDSAFLMQSRGQRAASSVLSVMRAANIVLCKDSTSPASLIAKLADWVWASNDSFSVFGIKKSIPIDTGWIPISVVIQGTEGKAPKGLDEALEFYHNWNKREFRSRDDGLAPETIGRFYRRCVVVAGPGMGKSTLIKKLARTYAKDCLPVLKVKLPLIAARMQQHGLGFEEALLAHGLDGSGLSVKTVADSGISNWVALCDGLDECGQYQEEIAQGILNFGAGHPDCSIVVATRPIGYTTESLEAWRHYELLPLEADQESQHLSTMLESIYPDDEEEQGKILHFALTEIGKSKSNKTVTRSPLLLGLTLSLAVRGQPFGQSKEQLYQKIFDVIDEIPNSRNPSVPPQKPTLLRFLDILGWVLIENPVSGVDQVIDRCAKELAAETGAMPLVSRDISKLCSEYWQSVGILERVNHAGSEALTFIHKTFGEYAAGHYLARSTIEVQRELIPGLLQRSGTDEVLSFAGAMGAADVLCEELLKRAAASDGDSPDVALALRLVAEAVPPPNDAVRRSVIDVVSQYLRSDSEIVAYRVAGSLNAAAKRFPAELTPYLSSLRQHQHPWTRLCAWSALLSAGTHGYEYREMVSAFAVLPNEAKSGVRGRLGGGLAMFRFDGHELMDTFVLLSMERLLVEGEPAEADALIKLVFENDALHGIWLVQKAQRLLERHGRMYSLATSGRGFDRLWDHVNSAEYAQANATAFTKMIEPLTTGDFIPVGARANDRLLMVSAFFQLTNIWGVSGRDVWSWKDGPLDDEAATVIRYVRDIVDIDPAVLAAEAAEFVNRVSMPDPEGRLSMFDHVTHVDIPELDWSRAKGRGFDADLVERALQHRSEWLLTLAGNLMQHIVEPADLMPRLVRLADVVTGPALAVVAYLAKLLPNDDMHKLLAGRLRKEAVYGSYHLFGALTEVPPALDDVWREILRINLLRKAPNTAVGAAKLAGVLANPGDADLEALLWEAYEFWKVNEEPYPQGSGEVPASPRSELLKALQKIAHITDSKLFEASNDVRSDVRDAVKGIVQERASDPVFFASLIATVSGGGGGRAWIAGLLADKRPLHPDSIPRIVALLQSGDPKLRYMAIGVLDTMYLAQSEIEELTAQLRTDPESEIREKAKRIAKARRLSIN